MLPIYTRQADRIRPVQTELRAGATTWVRPAVSSSPSRRLTLFVSRRPWPTSYVDGHSVPQFHSLTLAFSQIAVNASILADTGGTCVCTAADLCVADDVFLACKAQIKRELITTTAAVSCLSSVLMGVLANLPVGLAPGLGLNAYVSLLSPRLPGESPRLNHMSPGSSRTRSSDFTAAGP